MCRTLSSSSSSRAGAAVAARNGRREHMGALTPGAQFNLHVCVVCERANMSLGFLQADLSCQASSLAGVIVAGVISRGCVRASSARLSTSTKENALVTCTQLHVTRYRGCCRLSHSPRKNANFQHELALCYNGQYLIQFCYICR